MQKSKKIKIYFILPSLRAGGAERVMSYVAQNLNPTTFDATLLIIGFEKDASYKVEGIKTIFLNKTRVLNGFFPLINYLRKDKPDIVITAISHLNTMMALQSVFFSKIKFIGREVNVLSVLNQIQKSKRFYPSFLTDFSYKLLDKIVCQSKDMANDVMQYLKVSPEKIVIINNPISEKFTPKKDHLSSEIKQFITVGSLVKRKGHERILNILSKVETPFHYTIIGDGNEKEHLFSVIKTLGLTDKITHIPFTNEVEKYLEKSDVFLQGSFVEGFPNALLESCATGTPVIAFNILGGINEIVEENVNGYIADNETDFLNKIKLSIKKEWNPEVVSKSVTTKFNKEKIVNDYENLFIKVLKN